MSLGEGIAWCPQPIDDAQIYGSAAIISLLPFYTFSFRYGKYCDILLVARRGSGNLRDWTREGFGGFVKTFYLGVEWGFTSSWDFRDPEIGDFLSCGKRQKIGRAQHFRVWVRGNYLGIVYLVEVADFGDGQGLLVLAWGLLHHRPTCHSYW